jgi:hypothetical protein
MNDARRRSHGICIDTMPMCARPSKLASVKSMIGLILYRLQIRRVPVRRERFAGIIGLK